MKLTKEILKELLEDKDNVKRLQEEIWKNKLENKSTITIDKRMHPKLKQVCKYFEMNITDTVTLLIELSYDLTQSTK